MAYPSILTNKGIQKLASATPEKQLKITHVAVGDGGGSYQELKPTMTALVAEKWRGPASAPIRDKNNKSILIFEAIVPANIGGFSIREAAIFDDQGDMIAIGQTALTEKPADTSGTALTLTVRFRMQLSNSAQTNLVYNDQPFMDHEGLTGREKDNAHPMSAIAGLNAALSNKADKTTFVYAGTGLSGGGDLSSSRTLSVKYGTTAGTSAQGNDSRLYDAREWIADTVSQAEATAGESNVRRAWTSQRVRQNIGGWWSGVSTAFTRMIIGRETAAQVRQDLQLGSAATRNVGTGDGELPPVGAFGIGRELDFRGKIEETGKPKDLYGLGYRCGFSVGKVLGIPGMTDYSYGVLEILSGYSHVNGILSINRRFTRDGVIYTQRPVSEDQWGDWIASVNEVGLDRSLNGKADKTITIIAGTGLSGGGNLTANRTLTVNYGATAGTAAQGNDSRIVNSVQILGDQTIGGVKTFLLFPVGPINVPSTPHQLANKRYVDSMSFGYEQSWMNMTDNRSIGVSYTNTSGRTRSVKVTLRVSSTPEVNAYIYVNDVISSFIDRAALNADITLTAEVPNNSEYRLAGNNVTLIRWSELR